MIVVWNAIPNERPNIFSAFVSRITRNLALKKYEYISAAKRNPAAITSLEELGDCVSGSESIESELESPMSLEEFEDEETGYAGNSRFLLSTENGTYAIMYATDVQFDENSPSQMEEYNSMAQYMKKIQIVMNGLLE